MNNRTKTILNEDVSAPTPEAKCTFRGGRAVKKLLRANHCLYKYTEHPLYSHKGISPFWSSVEPVITGDSGLAILQKRAETLLADDNQLARARSAVTRQWNTMTYLLISRLTLPVYAFVGQASGQFLEQDKGQEKGERPNTNVILIGGAWQVWIPGLTKEHIVEVSRCRATRTA